MERLSILTWNVAGWRTTIDKIKREDGSLEKWLSKNSIDILCLQEIKLSDEDIQFKPDEFGANMSGRYDTFWSLPDTTASISTSQGRGLNGVATFARSGLTSAANSKIFDEAEFNCEGRCLVTEHGYFVIFNVYAPFSGSLYGRHGFKLRFLSALQYQMDRYRKMGKKVILLGDLNICPSHIDCSPLFSKVCVDEILNVDVDRIDENKAFQTLVQSPFCSKSSIRLFYDIFSCFQSSWNHIKSSLANRWIEDESSNVIVRLHSLALGSDSIKIPSSTDKRRFRVCVMHNNEKIRLGPLRPFFPSLDYNISPITLDCEENKLIMSSLQLYFDIKTMEIKLLSNLFDTSSMNDNARYIHIRTGNIFSLDELIDIHNKLIAPNRPDYLQNETIDSDNTIPLGSNEAFEYWKSLCRHHTYRHLNWEHWSLLLELWGQSCHPNSSTSFFNDQLCSNDGFVDVYRRCNSAHRYGYTCWDQSTRKRDDNEGSRIDHILLDQDLWKSILELNPDLDQNPALESTNGAQSNISSSTSNSRIRYFFSPADHQFYSSHLSKAMFMSNTLNLDSFVGCRLAYTPAAFSDHIGVVLSCNFPSCLENGKRLGSLLLDESITTKKAQPHLRNKKITSFFFTKPSSNGNQEVSIPMKAAPSSEHLIQQNSSKKRGLDVFFQPLKR